MNHTELKTTLQALLILTSENKLVEFNRRKNTYHFVKLGKYFSALSNEVNFKSKNAV